MADLKNVIIQELEVLMKKEKQEKQVFKARAYGKVISQIRAIPGEVRCIDDLKEVKGIGDKIHLKLIEIFQTGALKVAQKVRNDEQFDVKEELMQVHGIGAAKAKQLVEVHGIKSLDDLRRNAHLVNATQRIGLKYVEDLKHRIPREEMLAHEKRIKRIVGLVSKDFDVVLVGSYRRGAPDSGDIDVLLRLPESYDQKMCSTLFNDVCTKMMNDEHYITDMLALGNKKCMAVCKLCEDMFARRIDLLITPFHEYPYAILYFTGSDKFNVAMRKVAITKGYSMSEHGMKKIRDDVPNVPQMKNEKDIFEFLGMTYTSPLQRDTTKNL